MLKRERKFLNKVNRHKSLFSSTLCQEIPVSENRSRGDSQKLSEDKVINVPAGAPSLSLNQLFYPTRTIFSGQQRTLTANKTVSLTKGMFLPTIGYSSVLALAGRVPSQLKATFITGSVAVIPEYKISKNTKTTDGGDVIYKMKQIEDLSGTSHTLAG